MKQTFTFTAFMVLFVFIVFADNTVASNIGKSGKSRFEKNFNGLNPNDIHFWQGHKNSKKRIASENFRLKSAQAIKQRLDSYSYRELDESTSQWVTDYKVEYTYDANWNIAQYLEYGLDETTGQFTLNWKFDYSYDAKGNYIQGISYGGWADDRETIHLPVTVFDYKETFSYDANGNMTQDFGYNWDKISNQFVIDRKNEYTYDASRNLTQYIHSWFDKNHSETKTKDEYKYDTKGKLTQTTYFQFSANTNEWTKGDLEEYTYDSNGNIKLVVLTQHTGSINGVEQSVTFNKEEYTYDSKGNNILILRTRHGGFWDGVEQYDYEKDEYTYNDNGRVTQYLNSSTDYNGVWVFSGKDNGANSYDDKGNLIQAVYYRWDEKTNKLIDDSREDYVFDYKYTTNDLIVPWWWADEFDSPNSNMITEMSDYSWNSVTNGWESDGKTILSYSPVNVTSVNQLNSGITSVYPNPCSESVSFSIPDSYSQITFELFDLQGRKLMSKAISNNEKVNMESFRSGMYLYKLNVDGKMQSGKLVKK